MQEKLIHYIWQNLLFDTQSLVGTAGEIIQIIRKGSINPHAGPDFTNARILINNTLWIGNVEIHKNPGDWILHGHHSDKLYDTTILHVCWDAGVEVLRTDGSRIPCLILSDKVDLNLLNNYKFLMQNLQEIPCGNVIHKVNEFTLTFWFERLVIERLEQKTKSIFELLKQSRFDWQEVFYRHIARSFGLKVNADPFENLAMNLPLKLLSKHQNQPLQIEALLLGVAGFLNIQKQDEYLQTLRTHYDFFKTKYNLQTVEPETWKFLRLMPANFPTVRLAQFSALICKSTNLFSKVIETDSYREIRDLLKVTASEYWNTHYIPGEISGLKPKTLGDAAINTIIINTIVPFKFAYGRHRDKQKMVQNALDLLDTTPPENNVIVRIWEGLGINSKNSFQTQALLQLKNEYCNSKRCLSCNIGCKLLRDENNGFS